LVKESTVHNYISSCRSCAFCNFQLLVGILIMSLLPLTGNGQNKITPVVLESAELAICGTTNINNFTCQLFKRNLNDTLNYVSVTADGAELFNGLVLKFNVSDFACDHSMMTKDFKELLKVDDFPYIVMNINEVVVNRPANQIDSESISAHITLHIAGRSKREYIENARIEKTDQWLALSGSHKVLMTTFEIEPPVKLFGTVRTEDMIEILFSIKLK